MWKSLAALLLVFCLPCLGLNLPAASASDVDPAGAADAAGAGGTTQPAATQPTTRPAHRLVDRVLVISVDGMRPDMMLRCRTPNMHRLLEEGTFTFWAKTVPQAITLPSHVSMLTGVNPRKHGIEWNKDLPLAKPVYPAYPPLFQVAHKAGYTTALVAGKSKFETLAVPGTVDFQAISEQSTSEDIEVADHAVRIIREHRPQVMFVHFPGTDNAGHSKGWGSPEQVEAVEGADAAVGAVVQALADAKLIDQTVVILTADHGGAGKSHGPEDPRARHIPWIIRGPGIRKNVDLTTYGDLEVRTEDTFATSCYLLGIPLAKGIDGKPVMEVLQNRGELLHAAAGAAADAPTGR